MLLLFLIKGNAILGLDAIPYRCIDVTRGYNQIKNYEETIITDKNVMFIQVTILKGYIRNIHKYSFLAAVSITCFLQCVNHLNT